MLFFSEVFLFYSFAPLFPWWVEETFFFAFLLFRGSFFFPRAASSSSSLSDCFRPQRFVPPLLFSVRSFQGLSALETRCLRLDLSMSIMSLATRLGVLLRLLPLRWSKTRRPVETVTPAVRRFRRLLALVVIRSPVDIFFRLLLTLRLRPISSTTEKIRTKNSLPLLLLPLP